MTTTSAQMLMGYDSPAGIHDECVDELGEIRPAWRELASLLTGLKADGIADRVVQIDDLVRSNGASFRPDPALTDPIIGDVGGQTESNDSARPWHLSVTPMILSQREFDSLAAGIAQRTRLLEAVLADLLGDQRLLRDRVVPRELLWSNRLFYRSYHRLVGARSSDKAFRRLHVTGCDVTRQSGGGWCVLGDRTRAPSGLGYTLENRIVYSRVFPHWHRQANALRLAGFFSSLRNHFQSLAPRQRENPRIVLLTPGQGSYRDFEDAYLARYLGFDLVQGRDLAIRGNRLFLKTLGGLLPVEVMWRHVSDRKCDPLELLPNSTEGVTGLLRCIRGGHAAIANAIEDKIRAAHGLDFDMPEGEKHEDDDDDAA
ncbi:MAG: circularly permuted type 2 ATP-grasp protein, partial [Planctomycetota bacterium]